MNVLSDLQAPDSTGEQGERSDACPYLRRTTPHSWYRIEGYCLAHPYGGGFKLLPLPSFARCAHRPSTFGANCTADGTNKPWSRGIRDAQQPETSLLPNWHQGAGE